MRKMLNIGDVLATHRNYVGLTQKQLANNIGVDPSHIGHIENGRRVPNGRLLLKLMWELDIEHGHFFA